jgi:hypothetical protein
VEENFHLCEARLRNCTEGCKRQTELPDLRTLMSPRGGKQENDHHRGPRPWSRPRTVGHLGPLAAPYPQTWLPTGKKQKARGERDTERSTKSRICRFPTKSVASSEHPCKINKPCELNKKEKEKEKREERREQESGKEEGKGKGRQTREGWRRPRAAPQAPWGPRPWSRPSTMVEAQDGGPLGPPGSTLPPDAVAYGLRPT